ncbi:MAG: AI-2E family transporter [Candidatus Nealsonbacteria bacterium]
MEDERILDISWGTILKIAIVFLGIYILFLIKDILIWILFAFIISILFNPVINLLQKIRIPRVIATLVVYVAVFAVFSFLFYWTIPVFLFEIQDFTQLFPQYFERLAPPLRSLDIEAFESFETFTQALQDWLVKVSSSIFGAIISIFGGILSMVTIFALAFFFSMEEKEVEQTIKLLVPKKNEAYFLDLWERCQAKTAAWFGTRVLSSVFVGLVSYLTLEIFNINYAFVLGLFSGVMDIVPVLGPIFATILIVMLAALDSWSKALLVLIAFILIQQIEGNVLTPLLTEKMVGLPAILVLIALLVGGRLWGILGAILIIPLTGMIYEFLRDLLKKRREEKAELV